MEPAHEAPLLETISKRSPFGALLSRTLPNYGGPLPVGVCDVEILVPRQTFGSFKHKKLPNAEAGLAMDTVLFSLFYPAEPGSSNERVVWFPRLKQTIDGFLRMAKRTNWLYRTVAYPLAAAAIYGTTFPGRPNAPLRPPPASDDPDKKHWPLMIFSHGVGCSRLMYSAFCGEMASRGYVCCAIEHRDGTSPSSTIVTEDGRAKKLEWLQWTDLVWPDMDTQPLDDTTLRHEQIKMRVAEIDEVIKAMTHLSQSGTISTNAINPDFDWGRWRCLDTRKPVMAGHSLGGSAAIVAGADSRFTFNSILAFDPAVQRIDPWSSPILAPLLVVNSEEFTQSTDFPRLIRLVKHAILALVFSVSGSTHPSFSDVFLILPNYINRVTGLRADADRVLKLCVHAVTQFLGGNTQVLKDHAHKVSSDAAANEETLKEGTFLYHEVQ